MVTGEERIREHAGQLYGAVTGYDGKPTDYQVARTESLGHELQDVIDDFQKLTQKELPGDQCRLEKEETGSDHGAQPKQSGRKRKQSLRRLRARECGPRKRAGCGKRTRMMIERIESTSREIYCSRQFCRCGVHDKAVGKTIRKTSCPRSERRNLCPDISQQPADA